MNKNPADLHINYGILLDNGGNGGFQTPRYRLNSGVEFRHHQQKAIPQFSPLNRIRIHQILELHVERENIRLFLQTVYPFQDTRELYRTFMKKLLQTGNDGNRFGNLFIHLRKSFQRGHRLEVLMGLFKTLHVHRQGIMNTLLLKAQ